MAYVARASLTIHVPAATAYERLADHDSWARWMPAIFRPVGPGRGRLTEGTRLRVKITGTPLPVSVRVTVARPGRELTWCGGRRGVLYAEHRFLFEPDGASSVRIDSIETWSGPLAALLRPVIQPKAIRIGQDQLAALATALAS